MKRKSGTFRYTAWIWIAAAGAWVLLGWGWRYALDRRLAADLARLEACLECDPDPALLIEGRAADGEMVYRNAALGLRVLGGPPAASEGAGGVEFRSDRMHDGARIRLASRRVRGSILVRVALSEDPLRRGLRAAAWAAAALALAATWQRLCRSR